jgi:hypothetical protein
VPVSEFATLDSARGAHIAYVAAKADQRPYLAPSDHDVPWT